MVIRPCEPRGSSWPADYRSYAVELHRKIEAGTITKQEAQLRPANRYPRYDLPDKRTWRRQAHEKYPDLPEKRREFFETQAIDGHTAQQQALGTPWVHQSLQPLMPRPSMLSRIEESCSLMMNFVVAVTIIRAAAHVSNYIGEPPNEMLKNSA